MQILFINTNPIVQKLIEVTAAKANVKLVTVREPSQIGDIAKYDYIIADDGCYGIDKSQYKQLIKNRRACLIYSKEMYSGFSEYIKKPFIPTHILNIIIEEIAKSKKEHSFESIEEEVMPEDMSVDSVLQATRAMRTEDSLSNLDLLSKELNIKHPEATSQDKVNASFAKESADEPPAKEISTEDLLADTDLHKDENTQEALDIDDINLDDLVSEDSQESPTQESTPKQDAQPPKESSEPAEEVAPKVQEDSTQESNATQEPQVLDKEQISEVNELLDAIGDESPVESNATEDKASEEELAQISDVQDAQPPKESSEEADITTQEVASEDAPEQVEVKDLDDTPKESVSDEIGDLALDLDALGLEIGEKTDESAKSTSQGSDELDLDSLNLSPQDEGKETNETQEAQETTQVPSEESSQDAQEFFADVPNEEEISEIAPQETPTVEATEESPQEPTIQDTQDLQDDLVLEDIAEQDIAPASEEVQSDLSLEENAKEFEGIEADLALDEESIKEEAKETQEELVDIQMPSDEASAGEEVAISAEDSLDIATEDSQMDTQSTEDFTNLNENEVAVALGEEPLATTEVIDTPTQEDSKSQESGALQDDLDTVKNAIGKSLEGALQSMASNELKTLLDGMEVSINISFKDAKK